MKTPRPTPQQKEKALNKANAFLRKHAHHPLDRLSAECDAYRTAHLNFAQHHRLCALAMALAWTHYALHKISHTNTKKGTPQ